LSLRQLKGLVIIESAFIVVRLCISWLTLARRFGRLLETEVIRARCSKGGQSMLDIAGL